MKLRSSIFSKGGILVWDALLTLLVVSLIMHSMLIAIQAYRRIYDIERADYTADFEQFLVLLEAELTHYEILDVTSNKIKMKDAKGQYEVIQQNQKIIKTPGHHPYAYHIKEWELSYFAPFIEINVTFDNQQLFYGVIVDE